MLFTLANNPDIATGIESSRNPQVILGIHALQSPWKVFVRQDLEGELEELSMRCIQSRPVGQAAATVA